MIPRVVVCRCVEDHLATNEFFAFLGDIQDGVLLQVGKFRLASLDPSTFNPDQWMRFRTLMLRMARKNRIVSCDTIDTSCTMTDACTCQAELSVADYVLCCKTGSLGSGELILGRYSALQARTTLRRYDFSVRQPLSINSFLHDYVKRFVAFVDEVTIVDRQLGQYWNNPGYVRTLDHLVPFLSALGISVKLVTSADTYEIPLHSYCATRGIKLLNRIYKSLPHDRAILTRRFVLQIDRGFDLFLKSGKLRRTGIFVQQSDTDFTREIASSVPKSPNYMCAACHACF